MIIKKRWSIYLFITFIMCPEYTACIRSLHNKIFSFKLQQKCKRSKQKYHHCLHTKQMVHDLLEILKLYFQFKYKFP